MALVDLSGFAIAEIAGYRLYRYSLADGMSIRIKKENNHMKKPFF